MVGFVFPADFVSAVNYTPIQYEYTGGISTQTLTKDKSPYYVYGGCTNNTLKAGKTLTIEAGVVVKFSDNRPCGFWGTLYTSITLQGNLIVNGTKEEPVIFTSYHDDASGGDTNGDGNTTVPNKGDWGRIQIGTSNGNVSINNAIFKYGGSNRGIIEIGNVSSVNALENLEFAYSGSYGLFSSLPITIHNARFHDNNAGALWVNSMWTNPTDATNNWWGDDSGPTVASNPNGKGEKIFGNILYDPWIGKNLPKDPVIIVPGIMGSYLNRGETSNHEVWPNLDRMFFSPSDDYLNELILTSTGWPSSVDNLLSTDVIRSIAEKNFFQGLIEELENNGYEEGKDLFVFPYDWRLNIDWLAGDSPLPNHLGLKEKIEEVKNLTHSDKVDIITHSMGGLVFKKYIYKYGDGSINKFIDIATPHLGAPKAFKALMYGDSMNIVIGNKISLLNKDRIQFVTQNMPSIYALLPSQKYFDNTDNDYKNYVADVYDVDNNNVKGNLDYNQTLEFMKNTGRNAGLIDLSSSLHNETDSISVSSTYNIIGCGQPTIGKIYVLNKEKTGSSEYGLRYISGDSTVPMKSAEAIDSEKFYITGSEHSVIPSADGVRQLVVSILKNEQNNFDYSHYPNISRSTGNCSFSGTQVSFHSPIDLHVYDENNNHLGKIETGDIEMGIVGATYDEIDGNKFAFLPYGHNYRVVGTATNTGTFNTRITSIENGAYTQTAYFNETPLRTVSTTVQFDIPSTQNNYIMSIDNDGDGTLDDEITPSAILDEEELDDFTKPETTSNILTQQGQNGWYKSNVTIELNAQDNENGSGILKTEYSLDNGQYWQIYKYPFTVIQEGEIKIIYSSTDRAGNREENKEIIIKIDKTGPQINSTIPFDNQEFLHSENFAISYEAMDNLSKINTSTEKIMIDNVHINSTDIIDLFNFELGEHILQINLSDLAGNVSIKQIKFKITTNIDSTISDIHRSYNEGLITTDIVENKLIRQLEWIKEFIYKYINIANFMPYEEYRKVVLIKYNILLKELLNYLKKEWINNKGYDIIQKDIEYLISSF